MDDMEKIKMINELEEAGARIITAEDARVLLGVLERASKRKLTDFLTPKDEELEMQPVAPVSNQQEQEEEQQPTKKPKLDWECEGQFWLDPPQSCAKGTDKNFSKKDPCRENGKAHTLCRMCKNALKRKRRAAAKKEKAKGIKDITI